MDIASPPTARSAGQMTLNTEECTLFTLARKFIMLAMISVTNNWHSNVRYRDSHHPSATGDGQQTP
jgi:hypothetical protein